MIETLVLLSVFLGLAVVLLIGDIIRWKFPKFQRGIDRMMKMEEEE